MNRAPDVLCAVPLKNTIANLSARLGDHDSTAAEINSLIVGKLAAVYQKLRLSAHSYRAPPSLGLIANKLAVGHRDRGIVGPQTAALPRHGCW